MNWLALILGLAFGLMTLVSVSTIIILIMLKKRKKKLQPKRPSDKSYVDIEVYDVVDQKYQGDLYDEVDVRNENQYVDQHAQFEFDVYQDINTGYIDMTIINKRTDK